MTSNTLSFLFIGIALSVIGIIACRYYRWKHIKAYIPLLLGLSLIYLTTLGPLAHIKERSGTAPQLDSSRNTLLLVPGKNDGKSDQR